MASSDSFWDKLKEYNQSARHVDAYTQQNPAVDLKNRNQIPGQTMQASGYSVPNGDYASLYSTSFDIGGKEYLFTPIRPDGTIIPNGKLGDYVMGEIAKGKNPEDLDVYLGKFNNYKEADRYGEQLHNDVARWDTAKKTMSNETMNENLQQFWQNIRNKNAGGKN